MGGGTVLKQGIFSLDTPLKLPNFQLNQPLVQLTAKISVIVCVHNALADVQRCLHSLVQHSPDVALILVDDGSDAATQQFLLAHAQQHHCVYLRNEQAQGYTCAANQGLKASTADYVLLLNSDTVVSAHGLQGLLACAQSDETIGMVGPLSNTASWQSIPEFEQNGDWAANRLPLDMDIDQMAQRVRATASCIYPRLPFLNGFCLLIKRKLINDIGYFDAENFAQGYGEENDYCLRASKAGWALVVADDVYVYHAQSKSYSTERRLQLAGRAHQILVEKHGASLIEQGVAVCRNQPLLQSVRHRAKLLLERWQYIAQGQYRYQGKKVLFVLPVAHAGGGANVVISEAQALRHMQVDAQILNFKHHQPSFERDYPDLAVPVWYAVSESHILRLAQGFDAVVATAHYSIEWIAPLAMQPNPPRLGYYVQDFEPYFYVEKPAHWSIFWSSPWLRRRLAGYYFRRHPDFRRAWLSYRQIPQIRCFTKTQWNQRELALQVQQHCDLIGASVDVDLFQPRALRAPDGKRRVCAMIRPSSSRRGALRTLRVLKKIKQYYADKVKIYLFGVVADDPAFLALPHDFEHQHLGFLTSEQLALHLNYMDIFVDFSNFQAMGLTAMEAMACQTAVIVPQQGGANSFARHEHNSLIINTLCDKICYQALATLIEDVALCQKLATQAMQDIAQFYPEKTAYALLQCLFKDKSLP